MSGENVVDDEQNHLDKESLPKDKHDLITHFQEIVGDLDYDESAKIMVDNNWDLEQAVHKIMDIPIPSDVSTDSFHPISFQDQHVSASYKSSSEGTHRRNVGHNTPVEVNNQKVIKYTPSLHSPWYWQILSILWSPFRKIFDMFYYFFSAFKPDPRLSKCILVVNCPLLVTAGIVDPTNDVQSFIEQLQSEIPSSSSLPNFVPRPYGDCIADAKDNLQFLVVYLHDSSTSDSAAMVRDVLCSEKFKRLLREENVILWGCCVQSPEGYRVARLLRQNIYPFIGCIGLQTNYKMALLARIEGAFKCEEMVVKLRSVLHSNEAPMVAARSDREERTRNQHLRLQQDKDYAESLRQDREKDHVVQTQRENEERLRAMRLMEEQKEVHRKEEMARIRHQIIERMPAEADKVDGTLLVRIQLPSGQLSRRFYVTDSLKLLYYAVKSQCRAPWQFEISSNFPKRIWPVTPPNLEYDNEGGGGGTVVMIVRDPRPGMTDPPSFDEFGVTTNITVMVIDNEA